MQLSNSMVVYGDDVFNTLIVVSYINLDLYKSNTLILTNNKEDFLYYSESNFVNIDQISSIPTNSLLVIDGNFDIDISHIERILYIDRESVCIHDKNYNIHIRSYCGKFYLYIDNELIDLIHHSDYDEYISTYNTLLKYLN